MKTPEQMDKLETFKVDIPPGRSGDWEVDVFDATYIEKPNKADLGPGRNYHPGTFTRLTHRGRTIMSDTPDEVQDHMPFINRAHGRVLINGLGLGMVLKAVLAKPEVTKVDVVELSPDVINLVLPHYSDSRLTVYMDSAFDIRWPEGTKFQAVWHDIWPTLSLDWNPEMNRLEKKYKNMADWLGSWAKGHMQRMKGREPS